VDDLLRNWIGPLVGVFALVYVLWDRIAYLRQGRGYRRLSPEEQEALRSEDPAWEADHGRPLSSPMLLFLVAVAAGIVAYSIYSALGRFGGK
jgi:hypothetical protein